MSDQDDAASQEEQQAHPPKDFPDAPVEPVEHDDLPEHQ